GSRDTLTQVELNFPTLESAVRYAERQGLSYVVQNATEQADDGATRPAKPGRSTYGFSNMTLDRLGLGALQESYGCALDGAANRNDPSGPESWTSPMGVARDPKLTLEAKRSILMNWAWTEYLIDLATNEGMPENDRPSRLDEVQQALLALEREVAADQANSGMRKAA
ncbi:MAG: ETC complex I subunit, partial [Mesorhizobium sp.]